MASDIRLVESGNPINNGSAIIITGGSISPTGTYQVLEELAYHKPVIEDIDDKYDERLDDTTYYE